MYVKLYSTSPFVLYNPTSVVCPVHDKQPRQVTYTYPTPIAKCENNYHRSLLWLLDLQLWGVQQRARLFFPCRAFFLPGVHLWLTQFRSHQRGGARDGHQVDRKDQVGRLRACSKNIISMVDVFTLTNDINY